MSVNSLAFRTRSKCCNNFSGLLPSFAVLLTAAVLDVLTLGLLTLALVGTTFFFGLTTTSVGVKSVGLDTLCLATLLAAALAGVAGLPAFFGALTFFGAGMISICFLATLAGRFTGAASTGTSSTRVKSPSANSEAT